MQLASEYHGEGCGLSGPRSHELPPGHASEALYHRRLASFPEAVKMPTVTVKLVTGCML